MLKKIITLAIFIGFCSTLGGSVLPRLLFPGMFGPSYPPIWLHALVNFAVSGLVAFAVLALVELVRKMKRKRSGG